MKTKDEMIIIKDFIKNGKNWSVDLLLIYQKIIQQEVLRRQILIDLEDDFKRNIKWPELLKFQIELLK